MVLNLVSVEKGRATNYKSYTSQGDTHKDKFILNKKSIEAILKIIFNTRITPILISYMTAAHFIDFFNESTRGLLIDK